jgi:uncharacterized protein (DUF58 family)
VTWFRNILRPPNKREEGRPGLGRARQAKVTLPPAAFRQLDRLALTGRRELAGQGVGQRASARRKLAPDFIEHRAYVPGDDVRYVDWRASARSEHVYVRQGELPQETGVYFLVDASASMAWGQPPKHTGQLFNVASLGYLALSQDDRVMVHPFGERAQRPFGPISGKAQITALVSYLNRIQYGGESDLLRAARRLVARFSRGGILFILSDLLSVENLAAVLGLFPPPRWAVHVLQTLHPEEVDPALSGDLQLVDIEDGGNRNLDINNESLKGYQEHFEAWRREIELICIENYATHTILPTSWEHSDIFARLRAARILELR